MDGSRFKTGPSNPLTLLTAILLAGQALLSQAPTPAVPSTVPKPIARLPSKYSADPPSGQFERHLNESNVAAKSRSYLESKMKEDRVITDPGALVDGQSRTIRLRIVDYVGPLEPFPPSAKCVVVGTVTSAAAFVSRDKTYVYSDFVIKIESILKQDTSQPVDEHGSVLGYRSGGSIQFPSGHIKDFMTGREGFPAIGKRYVFFLSRWDDQSGRYHIGPAYEWKDDRVFPIDDYFPRYENMRQEEFMKAVRDSISAQSQR